MNKEGGTVFNPPNPKELRRLAVVEGYYNKKAH